MPNPRRGFSLFELVLSMAVLGVLLAALLPALSSARESSRRAACAGNQRALFVAWDAFLDHNGGRFPVVWVQPSWRYGGVRFSSADGTPFLDLDRPINRSLSLPREEAERVYECPSDRGISDSSREAGTGWRSAYQAFGTSYRANALLLSPARTGDPQGLARDRITTGPSRLVIMGDGGWHEAYESTGLESRWHGDTDSCNLLFLDGSVRLVTVAPRPKVGPAVFDPIAPELVFPLRPGGDGAAE
jgi:prepilin-type N-terminal cleavage/methylation domain-containing protein/prepilin-type processing-associated H-X9-DG protein